MSREALKALGITVLLIESEVESVFWLTYRGARAIALPWWMDGTSRGDELINLAYQGMMFTGQAMAS